MFRGTLLKLGTVTGIGVAGTIEVNIAGIFASLGDANGHCKGNQAQGTMNGLILNNGESATTNYTFVVGVE